MTRIALGLTYDGRAWHGWQSQPHRRTIQDALEEALSRFADRPVRVACAGRTDAGVHALGQVAHFDCDAKRTTQGWVRGVNALLPSSIAVTWSRVFDDAVDGRIGSGDGGGIDGGVDRAVDGGGDGPVDDGGAGAVDGMGGAVVDAGVDGEVGSTFDSRFDATARTYHYLLFVGPVRSPHWTGRAGWMHGSLDVAAMDAAAQALIGTHDFSAFRAAECQAKSPVKTMSTATVRRSGDFVLFTFRASAFLHHMVRNLVGALIAIGRGAKPARWIGDLLVGRDRKASAPTFMPDGLYLARVDYDARFAIPEPVPFEHVHAGFAAMRP